MHGGTIVLSIIWVFVLLGTTWWTKGTEYQNAWLYLFGIWAVFFAAFEVYYSRKNNKDK